MPAEGTPQRNIAIVGKAPSSRLLAPYDDPEWEIWTLSDLVPQQQAKRWDRHFELHPAHWIEQHNSPYWTWLKAQADKPVYTFHIGKDLIPAAVPFPLQQVLDAFGFRYYTNTVSYMIALGILEKPPKLGVWGVDMAQTAEYRNQRPSCEWLLGLAQGAGIGVVLPDECDLLKSPFLYGLHHDGGVMRRKWEARGEELQRRMNNQQQKLAQAQQMMEQHTANLHALQGAHDSQKYYEQWTWPEMWPEDA
jgi:hypothetical protein